MRTWAEINLDNLLYNLGKIREFAGNREILCVLKANAYGHGAVEIAKFLSRNGINIFAVACVDEAEELRKNGISNEIVILGCVTEEDWKKANELDVQLTLTSFENIRFIEKLKIYPKIHIAIDTGMGRRGFTPEDAKKAIDYIIKNNTAKIVGIYSHLSCADTSSENQYTKVQIDKFSTFNRYKVKYNHLLNSAGIFAFGEFSESNLLRAGIGLYGVNPMEYDLELKPVLALKSKVVFVKKIEEELSISYNRTYEAKKGEVIATIPVGYADGLNRSLSNKGYVRIHNVKCDIVGRITMDQIMVKIPDDIQEMISVGDEVVVYDNNLNELATLAGTISYELLTSLMPRVKRIYLKNGKKVIQTSLLERKTYEENL